METDNAIQERRRMIDGSEEPTARRVARWIGPVHYRRWARLRRAIEKGYPGVFDPDWVFGGKKYGWGLRYKKSKSFCTLIPEWERMVVVIVFGREERGRVGAILQNLSPDVSRAYTKATTFHDGKWVGIPIDRDEVLDDILALLAIKRKPRPGKTSGSSR